MSTKTRWSILLVLLVAALGCYAVGFGGGVVAFVVAGLGFELAFWIGLFRKVREGKKNQSL